MEFRPASICCGNLKKKLFFYFKLCDFIHDPLPGRKRKFFVGNDEKRFGNVLKIISNRPFAARKAIAFQLLFEAAHGK